MLKRATLFCIYFLAVSGLGLAQPDTAYTYRSGDPYGTGKWYMGREIAHVMGFHGADWLERPERNKEERTDKLLKNIDLKPGEHIADFGAGTGYLTYRLAALSEKSTVYAVELQDEMIHILRKRKEMEGTPNVQIVKCEERNTGLTPASIDKLVMVDVYHELTYPREVMQSICESLKPGGLLYLVEYRFEDEWVPIKKVHRMSEKQAVKEMEAAGLRLVKNIGNLPWQHCMVFEKSP